MSYQDVSGSFVYLAGLGFLFVCGMTGLIVIAINAYKIILTQLREAERETYAREVVDDTADILPVRKNA